MKIKVFITCTITWIFTIHGAISQIISPAKYLGYEPGSDFTPHHKITGYFQMLDQQSDKAIFLEYGHTYEGRPLGIVVISSSDNIKNIDELKALNLSFTGMKSGNSIPADRKNSKVIVWLSYGVHGNESSSSEAAMETAWQLLQESELTNKWLNNSIIIIDPCLNPDGRERYINWHNQVESDTLNYSHLSVEHNEPWPGGRFNHYLFDLNRDWAWATQQETQFRIKLYNEWMPHIHVDYHEQGINNPYYFAPAAQPYHELITSWQRSFQKLIGENHARYFDKNYWLYFTKERFDLFYPGYGDTYPTFNGAVGMTYEQAGGGDASLAILTQTGDTLTLKERIAHHVVTGISTVEIASRHAGEIIDNFSKFFNQASMSAGSTHKAYVVTEKNPVGKLDKLKKLLDLHKIEYGSIRESKAFKAFRYSDGKEVTITVGQNDLIIPVLQPKSTLVKVLFEPFSKLTDSLTYDITAWAIPYAYGLDAYALNENLTINSPKVIENYQELSDSLVYAIALERKSTEDLTVLSAILKTGTLVRTNLSPVTFKGKYFNSGSLFITQADNKNRKTGLDEWRRIFNDEIKADFNILSSGLSEQGTDLGSYNFPLIRALRTGLVTGDGVNPGNAGEIWYYFEKELNYPIQLIRSDYFRYVNLADLDVVILTDGYYSFLDEEYLKSLNDWIRKGGRLIVMGHALSYFSEKEGFGLKSFLNEEEKKEIEKMEGKQDYFKKYEVKERFELQDVITGGIFRVEMDNTHPLAFGYGKEYFTLKLSESRYSLLEKGWNVGMIRDAESKVTGFAGRNTKANLYKALVFGVEELGEGEVIYMVDNPLFRAFWEGGKLLFGNAVFMPR